MSHQVVSQFDAIFARIRRQYDQQAKPGAGLVCKQGSYGGCTVLKLQKPHWTNDRMDDVPNHTGVFFSIWIDEKNLRNHRTLYNVHALKMRSLKGYAITSIDFAKQFRDRFVKLQNVWPNVSTDFGPLTLMQGWIEVKPSCFEDDILRLMKRFLPVSRIIDELLAERISAVHRR